MPKIECYKTLRFYNSLNIEKSNLLYVTIIKYFEVGKKTLTLKSI